MDYWYNRPEADNSADADFEEVTHRELYGYDSYDSYEEYDGKLVPPGIMVTAEDIASFGVGDDDVRRMRDWSQENRL